MVVKLKYSIIVSIQPGVFAALHVLRRRPLLHRYLHPSAGFGCIIFVFPEPLFFLEVARQLRWLFVVLGAAALIGGILGGLSVRPRSGR